VGGGSKTGTVGRHSRPQGGEEKDNSPPPNGYFRLCHGRYVGRAMPRHPGNLGGGRELERKKGKGKASAGPATPGGESGRIGRDRVDTCSRSIESAEGGQREGARFSPVTVRRRGGGNIWVVSGTGAGVRQERGQREVPLLFLPRPFGGETAAVSVQGENHARVGVKRGRGGGTEFIIFLGDLFPRWGRAVQRPWLACPLGGGDGGKVRVFCW